MTVDASLCANVSLLLVPTSCNTRQGIKLVYVFSLVGPVVLQHFSGLFCGTGSVGCLK